MPVRMFIAKTFPTTTGQPSCQQLSMAVSPKRQSLVGILNSVKPFIQPAGPVSQTSSQSVTGFSEMPVAQPTGPVSQSTMDQKPAISVAVDVHQHPATGSSEIPVLQHARPASQVTVNQSVTSISANPL